MLLQKKPCVIAGLVAAMGVGLALSGPVCANAAESTSVDVYEIPVSEAARELQHELEQVGSDDAAAENGKQLTVVDAATSGNDVGESTGSNVTLGSENPGNPDSSSPDADANASAGKVDNSLEGSSSGDAESSDANDSAGTVEPSGDEGVGPGGEELVAAPEKTYAKGWNYDDTADEWHYSDNGGDCVKSDWRLINGNWYWFDENGLMSTGVKQVGDQGYHFRENGGYVGAMYTGWSQDASDSSWYYSNGSGSLQKGWVKAGSWYSMDPETYKMRTGWLELGPSESPTRYYLTGSGAMVSDNWVLDGPDWYYADGSGSTAKGWRYVRSSWYYLDPETGIMRTGWLELSGTRYYLGANGAMLTGWQNIDNGRYYFDSSGVCREEQTLSPVLGSPCASKEVVLSKMVAAYKRSCASYPASALSKGGAPSIESFCSILYEEAVDEGIRPELLFCQAMKETGWLRFGGIVKVEEFNFGGLGATDVDPDANKFPDVRTGLRAQTQHLVAYAKAGVSASDLHHDLVDVRFNLVNKGSAPYIQYLGIPDNPQGAGWASSSGYGYDIVQMMHDCFGI